jgi:hypothetical protein
LKGVRVYPCLRARVFGFDNTRGIWAGTSVFLQAAIRRPNIRISGTDNIRNPLADGYYK